MKVVKTQKNWVLGRRGYPVVFRFKPQGLLPSKYHKIVNWLKEHRGPECQFTWNDDKEMYRWATHVSRGKTWRDSSTYFIGLKDEADVSAVLLSIGD